MELWTPPNEDLFLERSWSYQPPFSPGAIATLPPVAHHEGTRVGLILRPPWDMPHYRLLHVAGEETIRWVLLKILVAAQLEQGIDETCPVCKAKIKTLKQKLSGPNCISNNYCHGGIFPEDNP